ncbi:hypothetical protein FEM48_Zijuj09G0075100 [Ziziphus jujuba var. spinosa]|uniref:Cyclin-dependent kinase inhibitor domain-containing protein n=1 Tax=Ziziphus jujuba var. spinosa TaxID=714518 RepID=A0A978URN3_ZIZJJ|nr:hypothetical protein FEM48_Zijuj09G0075100 [Ziziphus jujuba var. spinosa]
MGKYMKKSKIAGDVAVMEVSLSPQSSLGVRTRAKSLALQRQQQQQERKSTTIVEQQPDPDDSFSYLQLRSRRLVKSPLLGDTKNHHSHHEKVSKRSNGNGCCGENQPPKPNVSGPDSRLRMDSVDPVDSGLARSVVFEGQTENGNDVGIEISFGENNFDFENRDRESTPSNLIRESDTLGTPGSTTRQTNSNASNRRVRNDIQRTIPTAHEMEEFFAVAEQQQQRIFIDKYNFDFVNESPLPGRYEWVEVIP